MKISLILLCPQGISRQCEHAKHQLKIWSQCLLRLRLSSSLVVIILLYVLEAVAADKNEVQYEGTKESNGRIPYIVEYESALQKQLLDSPLPTRPQDEQEEKSADGVKRYKIVNVEFQRVQTPILIAMWIFCASLAKICFHMAPDLNQKVPESCLLVVVGVVIGLVLLCIRNIHIRALTPDTFFIYMLPPIILDAGYFMPNRLFFDNLGTILMFAVVGTIFNTLTIGGSLWLVNILGIFDSETSVLELFLFAALISAVDPVAVLAVFEEIHVNEILYIVVFGESLLNDAVTVVLYHMFEAFNTMGPSNILYTDLLASIASFFVVAIGGTIIGVIWGFFTGFVTRFTHQARVIEPILILVMAYISYLNAEMFHMSGILAITFCGITMKNYVEGNISHKSHTTVKYTMKMMSSSSETIIFMFLGVSTVSENHHWNTAFIVITIFFCTLYRFFGVMILSAILNHFRLYKLNTVDKFVMSYGGLRGAVAFALALLINPHHVKRREMFVTTTIAVIYFTVFIQGITIRPLVKILNVKKAEKRKPTMNERIHERFMDHMMAGIEGIIGHHGTYHVRDRFKRFDNQFIRPYILRNHQGAEPKILETYSKLAMKDALDFMRRNASTLGNMSNTGSVSAIFNAGNVPPSSSCSQLDSTWTVDMQEVDYNPSKKDLTDARIHHLLTTELCTPLITKSADSVPSRRLSYSRHIVDEKELTQTGYRRNISTRRTVGHHRRRSKRLNRDGKINRVSFPATSTEKEAKSDIEEDTIYSMGTFYDNGKNVESEDWEGGITFTVDPKKSKEMDAEQNGLKRAMLDATKKKFKNNRASSVITDGLKLTECRTPTVAEVSLPWHRLGCEESSSVAPTAVERKLPWSHCDGESDLESGTVKQSEFPSWSTNKEYLPYNSPSDKLMGKPMKSKLSSMFNLVRRNRSRDSIGSTDSGPRYSVTSSILAADGSLDAGTSRSYLSPHPTTLSPFRRGSMMELGPVRKRIAEDFLSSEAENKRGRSGSVNIPRKRDCLMSITLESSSSSSSRSKGDDDDDDELFG